MTHLGNLVINAGDKTDYSKLTEVSGSIYVSENATFTAPALTEVSGSIDVRQNATFTAPALTKSGSIDVRQNATFTAPALTVKNNIAKFNGKVPCYGLRRSLFLLRKRKKSKGITIYTGLTKLTITDNIVSGTETFMAEKDGFSHMVAL
jgi:hypothetical protein